MTLRSITLITLLLLTTESSAWAGEHEIDPTGRFVVYRADQDTDDMYELYRADVKTGAVIKLNLPLPMSGDVDHDRYVDPKGRFVVYIADQLNDSMDELFHADLKTGAITRLNGPIAMGGDVRDFQIGPKGRFAIYRADQDTDNVFELYRTDLKTGVNTKLNGPMQMNGDVQGQGYLGEYDWQIDPKGRFVTYRADSLDDGVYELYHVHLKTGVVSKLNDLLANGGDVDGPKPPPI